MPTPVSRRSVLRGAAGAGAAGLATTALGASALGASTRGVDPPRTSSRATEPIVVHVRDAGSGDIEVFAGTSQTRLRDRDLAARIAQAIR